MLIFYAKTAVSIFSTVQQRLRKVSNSLDFKRKLAGVSMEFTLPYSTSSFVENGEWNCNHVTSAQGTLLQTIALMDNLTTKAKLWAQPSPRRKADRYLSISITLFFPTLLSKGDRTLDNYRMSTLDHDLL